jgi:hypothetical protein
MWPSLDFQRLDRAPSYQSAPHLHMRKRDEYQSKVTEEAGLTRGRVPAPLLKHIGARPGDRLIFRVDESGKVAMLLARGRRKPAKKSQRR